jgi:TM2 domain-containing membrane protein YozV
VSLGLSNPIGALAPEPQHKSAGLAFGLSVLIPGAGQFYCGKIARGVVTFAFWLFGLVLCFSGAPQEWVGIGLILMMVLWIFSFLDAYFTAIEINQGHDEIVDVQNPRVAVTLNLLTAGFGYFYLGERAKGIALFVVVQVSRLAIPKMKGFAQGAISLVFIVIQLLMAADAYRIARKQVNEALGPDADQAVATAPPSRLPVFVPVGLACFLTFGFVLLIVIGLAVNASGWGKRLAMARQKRPPAVANSLPVLRGEARYRIPIEAVDLNTAVSDVQRVERRSQRTRQDLPYLKQDVRALDSVLAGKVGNDDEVVARYYRALAHTFANFVHEYEGEAMDLAGAHAALADFDKVITRSEAGVRTYIPEISVGNAQYWAGIVARNQLHDEGAAYAYWEKCAAGGHAGCMNDVAFGRITGEDGGKIDARGAVHLYSMVYNSGIRYRCAGALSAISLAEMGYFLGVQQRVAEDVDWTKKADDLLDQLQAREDDPTVCHRAEIEVEEFLLGLSRGERNNDILQDAVSHLSDDAKSTRAVIQMMLGAIDQNAFEAAVNSSKPEGARCSAYFEAMWYAELEKQDAMARRNYQHLVEIGKFHCGEELVYARKFNL